jgi:hypothetical protein
MRPLKNILFATTIFILISCSGTTHYLASGNFTNNESYRINSYYGCCGCEAKYFILYTGKRKTEQIIYSYNCYGTGKPTKFVFNYNQQGRLISCDRYVATNANDFTQILNKNERKLFSTVDTSFLLKANYSIIQFSEIQGFRKPLEKEIAHSFPLIRKGYKLPVHE